MAQRYYGRSRSYTSVQPDIEDFVRTSEKRMIALMRQSTQDVINEAQQAAGKGGRMRVDTGFLRASGQASLSGMPSGPIRGELKEPNSYTFNEATAEAKLGEWNLGGTLFFGWTAEYARYRELHDGFLEGALMHWARIVAFNTDTIRERIKK